MTLVGRNCVYEAANEAYCKTHNKTREEIIGKTVAEVWGEDVYNANIKECLGPVQKQLRTFTTQSR